MLAAAAGLFSGCGGGAKYDLPVQKTLVYSVTEQPGQVLEGKERYSTPAQTMEVRLRIKQRLSGTTAMDVTAHPPPGKSHAVFGRDLGKLNVKIDRRGAVLDTSGMGIPQEIRFFVPELPKKLKKKASWTEKIKVMYKSNTIDTDLKHQYMGKREAGGRKCYYFKGTAQYVVDEKVQNVGQRVDATLKYIFDYEEDYYFDIGRGYIVKTEIFEKRKRNVIDNLTGNIEFDEVDMNKKTIALVAVED